MSSCSPAECSLDLESRKSSYQGQSAISNEINNKNYSDINCNSLFINADTCTVRLHNVNGADRDEDPPSYYRLDGSVENPVLPKRDLRLAISEDCHASRGPGSAQVHSSNIASLGEAQKLALESSVSLLHEEALVGVVHPRRICNRVNMAATSHPNNLGVATSPNPFVFSQSFPAATYDLAPSVSRAKCISTTKRSSVICNRKSGGPIEGDLITNGPGPPLSNPETSDPVSEDDLDAISSKAVGQSMSEPNAFTGRNSFDKAEDCEVKNAHPRRFCNRMKMTVTSQPSNSIGVLASSSLSLTAATYYWAPSLARYKCKSTTKKSSAICTRKSGGLVDGDLITRIPRPPLSSMTSLSVNDMTSPADCERALEKCTQQGVLPYLRSRLPIIIDGCFSGSASSVDCSFNTCQPEDACDPLCFSDGFVDSIAHVEQEDSHEDDAESLLKNTRKDSSDLKSAMKRCLSLNKFVDFSVVPPPLLIYTLHSSDTGSEQDYVRNLMALQPEEREAIMKSEAERLRTYGSGFWPIREVMPPEELAAAGFYYTGVHDRVQCAFCRGVLRNWERGDSAMNEHRVHFSYCRLVMGLDCGNVPIAPGRPKGENTSSIPTRGGQANLFASTDRPLNDVPDNTSFANLLAHGQDFLATMGSGEPLPGVSTEKPKHPENAVEARRLQSFSTWPLWALQSPENLAKAGFYYAGFGDSVKCFYCDGGLRNWEIMDNPWEEHARWFKDCKYLLDVKGKAYVDEIEKKYAVGNEAARLVVAPAAVTSKVSPGPSLEHPSVQLVKSLGYSENQIRAALERFYLEHQTSTMPKGAELLDAVLQMEDEASGARPALGAAGRSLPTGGRMSTNEAATYPHAVAASRPLVTASVPPRFDRQHPEPDGIRSSPSVPVHNSRAAPDVKRQPEPPSERPLSSLHDIIFTGLVDIPDGEARCIEENRQMHKHLICKGCQQRPAEVVLLPCGHFSSCLECVPSLRNCPVCATVVRGTIRTYLC